MTEKSCLLVSFCALLAFSGCYEDTSPLEDVLEDAVPDTAPDREEADYHEIPDVVPDGNDQGQEMDSLDDCLRPHEPEVFDVEYEETVEVFMSFTLTITHETVAWPSSGYDISGEEISVWVSGYVCYCDPCYPFNESGVSEVTVEGLPAGEYTILIQDETYPLHVVE